MAALKDIWLWTKLRELQCIYTSEPYLADSVEGAEVEAIQSVLLILLQGYDIISKERTKDDVM